MTQEEMDQYVAGLKGPFAEQSALILIKNGDVYASAAVQLYGRTELTLEFLREAIPSMVEMLPEESTARLCGYIHPQAVGNFGLCLFPPPTAQDITEEFANYVPGSQGIVVYDCGTGMATCYAGQLATDNPVPIQMDIPLMLM